MEPPKPERPPAIHGTEFKSKCKQTSYSEGKKKLTFDYVSFLMAQGVKIKRAQKTGRKEELIRNVFLIRILLSGNSLSIEILITNDQFLVQTHSFRKVTRIDSTVISENAEVINMIRTSPGDSVSEEIENTDTLSTENRVKNFNPSTDHNELSLFYIPFTQKCKKRKRARFPPLISTDQS